MGEVDQKVLPIKAWVPVPQGADFLSKLDTLAAEHGVTIGRGDELCPAEVSGAGMRIESRD